MEERTKHILQKLGIEKLNEMQMMMGRYVQEGLSVMLLSPTGSGKTLAYLLPISENIDTTSDKLQAIVILPTRELAQQCHEVFSKLKTLCRTCCLHGGRPTMVEHARINEIKPHVIFSTPGRLKDHILKGNIEYKHLIKFLILDEFDKCLELGFQDEMCDILGKINLVGQTILVSATESDTIKGFVGNHLIQENIKELNFLYLNDELSSRVSVAFVKSERKDKLDTLLKLLTYIGACQTIVFVAHRESAIRVGDCLKKNGFHAEIYHGGLDQDLRERALFKFRNQTSNILIATDLAARGLDIPEVGAIVHYHLPLKEEDYVHRNGRTARWDSEGKTFLIIGTEESQPKYINSFEYIDVENIMVKPSVSMWSTIYIGKGKKDKLSKMDIVGFLCKKGNLDLKDIGRIDIAPCYSYVAVRRNKMLDVLKNIKGQKIKGMKTIFEQLRT